MTEKSTATSTSTSTLSPASAAASTAALVQRLSEQITSAFDDVGSLWTTIGIDNSVQEERASALRERLSAVVAEFRATAEKERTAFERELGELTAKREAMATELGEDPTTSAPDAKLSLCARCEAERSAAASLEEERASRVAALSDISERLRTLRSELGATSHDLPGELESPQRLHSTTIASLKDALSAWEQEKQERCQNVDQLVRGTIEPLWNALELTAETLPSDVRTAATRAIPFRGAAAYGITDEDIRALQALQSAAREVESARAQERTALEEELAVRWDAVERSQGERDAFLASHAGLGASALAALRTESAAVLEERRAKYRSRCAALSAELTQLYNELGVPQSDRLEPAMDAVAEELSAETEEIQRLEVEVARQQKSAALLRPILELIRRRDAVMQQKVEFDMMASDPSRLTKMNKEPGFLIKEEKKRKKLQTQIQKTTKELQEAVQTWEAENGEPFLYNGGRYLDELSGKDVKSGRRSAVAVALRSARKTPDDAEKENKRESPASRAATGRTPSSSRRRALPTPVSAKGSAKRSKLGK